MSEYVRKYLSRKGDNLVVKDREVDQKSHKKNDISLFTHFIANLV